MGMGAPDMRCGAKPCPDSHSRAEVGFFLVKSDFFLGVAASVEPAVKASFTDDFMFCSMHRRD